jgi:hypothetical protein
MVFEVLAEVTLIAGLCDGIPHLWQFHTLHMTEFGYELVVALL